MTRYGTRRNVLVGNNRLGFIVCDLNRSVAFYTTLLERGPFLRQIYEADYGLISSSAG